MQSLRFNTVALTDGFDACSAEVAATVAFREIFKSAAVPQDPDWRNRAGYTPQLFEDTAQNRAAAARAITALSQNPAVILSDIDGTGSVFTADAADSVFADGYKEAARALGGAGDMFAFVTGRSVQDARAILGGADIPVICSHGTIYLPAGGGREEFPLTAEEKEFVLIQHTYARGLDNALLVQLKHSGIDVKDMSGQMISAIRADMAALCAGRDDFRLHSEGPVEASIRYEKATKVNGIQSFILNRLQSPALALYIADSYGRDGTDRTSAEFIQSVGGLAVQVLNDRPANAPAANDAFRPDVVLPNPAAAAAFLGAVVEEKRKRKTGMGF